MTSRFVMEMDDIEVLSKRELGDKPGHEFHGNQWTDSSETDFRTSTVDQLIEDVVSRAGDKEGVRKWLEDTRLENEKQAQRSDTRRAVLQKLSAIGGIGMVYMPDPDLALLAENGRSFSPSNRVMALGRPNQCHSNVGRLFTRGRVDSIVVGYALPSDDFMWRQHTWGLKDGHLVETTYKYEKYFGVELTTAQAKKFARANR